MIQDNPSNIATLRLQALYDDGIVVYLNGTEVVRRGLPATGAVDYTTLADSDVEATQYEDIDLGAFKGLLVQGTNVLAVEVHQFEPGSADLVWDGDLTYTLAGASNDADGDGMLRDWEIANGFSDSDPVDALQDADSDGQNNRSEFQAATDPRDPLSCLKINTVVLNPAGGMVVRWSSVPGNHIVLVIVTTCNSGSASTPPATSPQQPRSLSSSTLVPLYLSSASIA